MYALMVLVIINIIILAHELGHFLTAKMLKVQPKTLGIGFWKTIYKWEGKDGVVYKLNILPLGGYVEFEDEGLRDQPIFKRFLILFSGVFYNFVLAFVVCFIFVAIVKIPLIFDSVTPMPPDASSLGTLFVYAWQSFYNCFEILLYSLDYLIRQPSIHNVAGPVMLIEQGSYMLKESLLMAYPLLILIDLNVALLNILPLPALDGGRMLFTVIEAVTKKRAMHEEKVHTIGLIALMGFMVFIIGKDVLYVFFK